MGFVIETLILVIMLVLYCRTNFYYNS